MVKMTNSLKMARLDLMTIKSLRTLLGAIAIPVFSAFTAPYWLVYITVSWSAVGLSANIFAVQEKNNLDRLYGSMSIRMKDIVLGRYCSGFLMYATSFFINTAIFFVMSPALFHQEIPSIDELWLGFSLSLLIFSCINGIRTPIYFKHGYTKVKAVSVLPSLLIIGLLFTRKILYNRLDIFAFLSAKKDHFILGSILASCIIQFLSYRISLTAHRRRN
jgi:hypothetical protein